MELLDKYFTQRDEERYILEFFNEKKDGTVLEIGAYHPELFSQSRRLIMNGWKGILVEPSPGCCKTLNSFYEGNPNIEIYNIAIGEIDGDLKFYDSTGAVATAREDHYNRWKSIQGDFKEIYVPCVTWENFYERIGRPKIDFISIDTEGMDWEILQQIDLDETETTLLSIEYTYNLDDMVNYLSKFNFSIICTTPENLIVGRNLKGQ